MDEQAEQALDTGVLGLAEYLTEQPEEDSDETQEEAADIQSEKSDQENESAEASEADDETEEESEHAKDQEPRKYKVTVKGEDGADVEKEVEESELISGYMRLSDYTRSKQDLAKRETEVTQALKSNHEQFLQEHLRQAEVAKAIVYQLAGVKTQQEMYQLAQDDPAAAVAERERQQVIHEFISQIDGYVSQINAKTAFESQQRTDEQRKAAWETLGKSNITREGLAKVYQDAASNYGVQQATLESLYDPGMVLMMRDALAFRDLKTKVPVVTKKANEAPRLPSGKPQQTKAERINKELENKFKSGRAKLNDLAAYLR
jgi:hypothetical protein